MKTRLSIFFFTLLCLTTKAQEARWWGGKTVSEVVDKSDLIFEGRIVSDSAFYQSNPGNIYTYHKVVVLKKFKGDFVSDTINVITWGGKVTINGQREGVPGAYAFKDDEAVFLVTNSQKIESGGNDPNAYWPFYGPGVSYVTPCNKKDPVKEVYEPLEKAIGHPYIELRPNRCKEWQEEQKKKPKPHVPMGPDGKPMSPSPSTN